MSYRHERDAFLLEVGRDLGLRTTTKLLRHANTLQRLAVAQCNGDYPCDNGKRKVMPCPLCESQYVPSQIRGGTLARFAWRDHAPADHKGTTACLDCRTDAAIRLLLHGSPYKAVTQGDPRGYVLRLYDTSATPANIDNGTARSIGVPALER
jgi:hypothetical protein